MKSTRRTTIGSVLLAIGGGLIALVSLKTSEPEWVEFVPEFIPQAVALVGMLCLVLGILFMLSNFVYIPILSKKKPVCRSIKRGELEILHNFSEDFFPGSFSLNGAKALYRLNRRMLIAVWQERAQLLSHGYERKMIGFFSLLPLNLEARDLLESNTFSPDHISPDYVLREYSKAKAIYLGGVAASIGNRGQVLAHLVLSLLDLARQGHTCIYTRPTTRRGLKLAEQYSFEAVRQEGIGNIYRLERKSLESKYSDPDRAHRVIGRADQDRSRAAKRSGLRIWLAERPDSRKKTT